PLAVFFVCHNSSLLSSKRKAESSHKELPAIHSFSVIYMICYIEHPYDFIAVPAEERTGHPRLPQQEIRFPYRPQSGVKHPLNAFFLEFIHRNQARSNSVDNKTTFLHLRSTNRAKHSAIPPVLSNP